MALSDLDAAREERMVAKFFSKSLHIILESRTPYSSSRNFSDDQVVSSPSSSSSCSPRVQQGDKWFNIELRDCPAALENIALWRRNNVKTMAVDVILVKRSLDWPSANSSPKEPPFRSSTLKNQYLGQWRSDKMEPSSEGTRERVIERWVLQYEVRRTKEGDEGEKRPSGSVVATAYKKLTLLLRSLYATVRILPAYKTYRELILSSHIPSFSLGHCVSAFPTPFTRQEEAEMRQFAFAPVDTFRGRLCLSVLYHSLIPDVSSGTSSPVSPRFISDYVGSPLADPLRSFPSLSGSHGSPSLPFPRGHSWSSDQNKTSQVDTSAAKLPCAASLLSKDNAPPLFVKGTQYGSLKTDKIHGESQTAPTVEKVSSLRNEEMVENYGSSSNLHLILPSKSSSKWSSGHDFEFDYSQIKCPFDMDDDDLIDLGNRLEYPKRIEKLPVPSECAGHLPNTKSQDAVVGTLVELLRKAPPLHQESSSLVKPSQPSTCGTTGNSVHEAPQLCNALTTGEGSSTFASSGVLASKTTTDALEELQVYSKIKRSLLQSRGRAMNLEDS